MPDPAQPRRNQRAFRFGDLVDLVMLEERLQRALAAAAGDHSHAGFGNGFVQAGAFADPARTLLGAEQEAWLAERAAQLDRALEVPRPGRDVRAAQGCRARRSPHGGGVFLNTDQWDGYQPARDRVYAVLKGGAARRR